MCGEGVVAFGSDTHLHEVVSATNGSDAVVEHVLAHVDALEEGGDALFRHIHVVHHLGPLLSGFSKPRLKMLVQLFHIIDRLLVNGHTKLDVLADGLLNGRIVCFIDRKVGDGCTDGATNVATYMVGVHMIGKRNGETNNDVLACMHIGHNPYFGLFEHWMVEKMVYHRQSVLFNIVCINLAVFAILSFKF